MFKVIQEYHNESHESGNPELETEIVSYTVLFQGAAIGVSFGTDESDGIISDFIIDNPEYKNCEAYAQNVWTSGQPLS